MTPTDLEKAEATPAALEYFKPPFKYEAMGQTIYAVGVDGHNMMALQVRGWGSLVGTGTAYKLPNDKAEHIQDEFGQWVCDAMNNATTHRLIDLERVEAMRKTKTPYLQDHGWNAALDAVIALVKGEK